MPWGCTQVSSPAGHNSDLISGIPCTGTWGTCRNNSFPFTINTWFVIKQDKDVNGLLLPEHSSCWGAVALIYCLWMWSSIAGGFMGSFCSLTMQNEAGKGTGIPYLFPFSWLCSYRTVWKQAVLQHTLVPWQYSLWLIRWYKIIHQKGLNVWLLTCRSGWSCVWWTGESVARTGPSSSRV